MNYLDPLVLNEQFQASQYLEAVNFQETLSFKTSVPTSEASRRKSGTYFIFKYCRNAQFTVILTLKVNICFVTFKYQSFCKH